MKRQAQVLTVFAIQCLCWAGIHGAMFNNLTPTLTRLSPANVDIQVLAENSSSDAIYFWSSNGNNVANLTLVNFTIGSMYTQPDYTVSANNTMGSNVVLTLNVTGATENLTVTLTGDMATTTSTLIVQASCGAPPTGYTSTCEILNCTGQSTTLTMRNGDPQTYNCSISAVCSENAEWVVMDSSENDCEPVGCAVRGTWGPNCTMSCGTGCPVEGRCDFRTGACYNLSAGGCLSNWEPSPTCENPVCPEGCNGGTCVYANLCQLCPVHFASGPTCRNIRLDGFLKGALPTFAVLTVVVIFLTVTSKWYIRRKLKIN